MQLLRQSDTEEDRNDVVMSTIGVNGTEDRREGYPEGQRLEKQCEVLMDHLNYQLVKNGAVITPVTIPKDFLPFCLDDFDILDAQGPAEQPKQALPYRPKLIKTLKSKGRGRSKK